MNWSKSIDVNFLVLLLPMLLLNFILVGYFTKTSTMSTPQPELLSLEESSAKPELVPFPRPTRSQVG